MPSQFVLPHFGRNALTRVETSATLPGPGEVRLAMQAASLNYRDLLMVEGTYNPRVPLPLVPGSDGVGCVDAIGPDVNPDVNGRFIPIFSQSWIEGPPTAEHLTTTLGGPIPGTLQSHCIVPVEAMVQAPSTWSNLEAATLPCAGVTAWHALKTAGVTRGSTVLCLGTGGVSLYALQLAKALGARVAITSSSDERLERCRTLGADETVNYGADPQWGKTVSRWAGGGVDCVVEVGGAGTMAQSLRATRVGGTIVLIGVLAGSHGEVPLVHALMRSIRIQGLFVGHAGHLDELCRFVESHDLRPVLGATFDYDDLPLAFERLEQGGTFGKIGIKMPV